MNAKAKTKSKLNPRKPANSKVKRRIPSSKNDAGLKGEKVLTELNDEQKAFLEFLATKKPKPEPVIPVIPLPVKEETKPEPEKPIKDYGVDRESKFEKLFSIIAPLILGAVFLGIGVNYKGFELYEGLIGGVFITFGLIMATSNNFRLIFRRRILGKNIGRVIFQSDGRFIKEVIINFNYPYFEHWGGTYTTDPTKTCSWGGVPTLFFAVGDSEPLDLTIKERKSWTPEKVNTALKSNYTMARLLAMSSVSNLLNLIAIGVAVTALFAVAATISSYNQGGASASTLSYCQMVLNQTMNMSIKAVPQATTIVMTR